MYCTLYLVSPLESHLIGQANGKNVDQGRVATIFLAQCESVTWRTAAHVNLSSDANLQSHFTPPCFFRFAFTPPSPRSVASDTGGQIVTQLASTTLKPLDNSMWFRNGDSRPGSSPGRKQRADRRKKLLLHRSSSSPSSGHPGCRDSSQTSCTVHVDAFSLQLKIDC